MESAWLDRFIQAWCSHAKAGGPTGKDELVDLLKVMDTRVRYEIVPTRSVFIGHEGIESMCIGVYEVSPDLHLEAVSQLTDGRFFAFEYVATGTDLRTGDIAGAPPARVVRRGCSIGEVASDGRIMSLREYPEPSWV